MGKVIYTNDSGYSLSIAAWLADDDYDHANVDGPYISVTELLKPIRMIILNQRMKILAQQEGTVEKIDIDRFVASRLGSAVHAAIEHSWSRNAGKMKAFVWALKKLGYPDNVVNKIRVNPTDEDLESDPEIIPVYMEKRSYREIDGYTVGGKYDFIGDGNLEDFKSMGVYGYMKADKDEEQLLQGSMYRWLNPKIVTSDVMKIQQIFTDWSKLEAIKGEKRGYPQKRILEKLLQLKPLDETEKWVRSKIALIKSMQEVPEPELPHCEAKDLWQTASTYSYFSNPDNKRATKNFDNSAEAHAYCAEKGKGEVREKKGVVKRCGYCNAYEICTQKDIYLNAGILSLP